MPRSRLIPAVGALLLAAAAAGSVVLLRDQEPRPANAAYRISYAVEDLVSGRRTTEVVEVDRPRLSRRLLPEGGSATTESGVFDRVGEQWRQLAVIPPGEPGQDLQLTAALQWAAGEGLAQSDGTGTVAGRACSWWVTREPLDVGSFAAATPADRARSCVDVAGRLLADTWRADGRDVRRRTATEITALAAVAVFDGTTPAAIDPQLQTTVVERLSAPTADLVGPVPLPGAKLVAAARFVDVAPGSTDVVRRGQRAVYLRNGVVVVLDQIREAAPVAPRGDADVALGVLGSGRIRAIGGGLVVEVQVGTGLLRVRSGLPLEELVDWLGTLRPV